MAAGKQSDVQIGKVNLSLYHADEIDDALPGIKDRVIVNEDSQVDELFESESSGLESHPTYCTHAPSAERTSPKHDVFIEHTGAYDPDNTMTPVQRSLASGLRNLEKN